MTTTAIPPTALRTRTALLETTGTLQGVGISAHHLGELAQGAADFDGKGVQRFLIDLPDRTQFTKAYVRLTPGEGRCNVEPAAFTKVAKAAELYLRRFCDKPLDAYVEIETSVTSGRGRGTSSADIVATFNALDFALRRRTSPVEIARLLVLAEGASNPVHLDRPVAFQHRRGHIARSYSNYPNVFAIGFDDPTLDDCLTDHLPPARYSRRQLDEFGTLLALAEHAFEKGSASALGRVSTRSAEINDEFLPKRLALIRAICSSVSGVGVAVSHSGSVSAILLDGADQDVLERVRDAKQALAAENFSEISAWGLQ